MLISHMDCKLTRAEGRVTSWTDQQFIGLTFRCHIHIDGQLSLFNYVYFEFSVKCARCWPGSGLDVIQTHDDGAYHYNTCLPLSVLQV